MRKESIPMFLIFVFGIRVAWNWIKVLLISFIYNHARNMQQYAPWKQQKEIGGKWKILYSLLWYVVFIYMYLSVLMLTTWLVSRSCMCVLLALRRCTDLRISQYARVLCFLNAFTNVKSEQLLLAQDFSIWSCSCCSQWCFSLRLAIQSIVADFRIVWHGQLIVSFAYIDI